MARGVTLAHALAAECNDKINEETWKKALQSHPEFSPLYQAGKGKFLADAVARLARHPDPKWMCWLLERRYPELFRKPDAAAVTVNTTVAVGMPEDVVARAKEVAAEDLKRAAVDPVGGKPKPGHG